MNEQAIIYQHLSQGLSYAVKQAAIRADELIVVPVVKDTLNALSRLDATYAETISVGISILEFALREFKEKAGMDVPVDLGE